MCQKRQSQSRTSQWRPPVCFTIFKNKLNQRLLSFSFLGYSVPTDTLVIDITHIDDAQISEDLETVRVGVGIHLGSLYTALDLHNKTFTGGICPTVGLSGYLGSGGFNLQIGTLGLAADHVLSATVVMAEGNAGTASKDQNADLFWTIRGGGAGTYGIIAD